MHNIGRFVIFKEVKQEDLLNTSSKIPGLYFVPYTVQEMLTLPEHLILLPVFSGVRFVSYLLFVTVDVNVH